MDKGLETAYHAPSSEGWTPGQLDFYVVEPNPFSDEDHETWRILFNRQMDVLSNRAIKQFITSLKDLGIDENRIPDITEVNNILKSRTGWQAVPVAGFMPDEAFFELLANRRFPIGNFIRSRDQLDYLQEPDIFHDLFGHIPLLVDPVFADYIEAFGHGGVSASKKGTLEKLSRLYWYTVEFGLIQEEEGVRIYGAGILSSATESQFSLESASPNRVKFDKKRVMQTHFRIDDFQETYFVIDSFKKLYEDTYEDFAPIYKELDGKPVIGPFDLTAGDIILHKGTGEYGVDAQKRREERAKASA